MTKPKEQKPKKRSKKYIRIGKHKIHKKFIIIAIALLFVIAIISYRRSDYWPWPTQSEMNQRLADVVDACIYNEGSSACKKLKNRYNVDFEYCYAMSDIPEIDNLMPIYGVARKKSFNELQFSRDAMYKLTGRKANAEPGDPIPENALNVESSGTIFPYYGCVSSLDEIRNQKGPNLISSPDTIALFGLSNIPQYYETYVPQDGYGCIFHRPWYNQLWEQIPNISTVKKTADNIFNMYPKCNMRTEIDHAINELNTRISNYANNYSVQLFYQKYDQWNSSATATCTWYEKKFNQYCGAAVSDKEGASHRYTMLKYFVEEMHDYLHTSNFTSKIVVTN